MLFIRKRKLAPIIIFLALIFLFNGCVPTIPPVSPPSDEQCDKGLYVDFIDVGQGDCILIKFPDQKSLMIDCGNGSDFAVKSVKDSLVLRKITNLDYVVLTHPDLDHVGGASEIFNEIGVANAFVPDVRDKQKFASFNSAVTALENVDAQIQAFDCYKYVKGENYSVAFLSPKPISNSNSSYRDFNFALEPTEEQMNNISPFIYLEYMGVRFLFTGDCGFSQESKLLNDYAIGVYSQIFGKYEINVNLEDIDFLKVSHHGSSDASSDGLLSLLRPKNAVISVGGKNIHNHPTTTVLTRLKDSNPDYKLFRTDYNGTVSVFVNEEGKVSIN